MRTDPHATVRGEVDAADQPPRPCLDVVLHRATRPHALINSVDVDGARSVDGVVAVVTGAQLYQRFGDALMTGSTFGQPCLAVDKVRYVGEPVAAVLARGLAPARRAAERIVVDYVELDAVHDMEATNSGEPDVVDQPHPSIDVGEPQRPRNGRNTNVNYTFNLQRGDVTAATKFGAVTVREEFWCPPTYQASLEPPFTAAWRDGDHLEILSATRTPSHLRQSVAQLLGIPLSAVRVHRPPVGRGGATMHANLEPLAAALAWSQQLPVRIVASPREAFLLTTQHGVAVTGSMTADRQGRIVAATADVRYDTGAHADLGPRLTAESGTTATGPYRIENVDVRSRCMYTNKPSAGYFHGFGTAHMAWSHESLVDELARRCGTDLVEFRRRNLLRAGDASPVGTRIDSADFVTCLDAVAKAVAWNSPMERVRGRLRRGRGVAVGATCYAGAAVRRSVTLTTEAKLTTSWVPYDAETDQLERVTEHWFAGAAAVQLTVDIATGRIHLEHLAVASDVGPAINPQLAEQQLKRTALMGIGHALFDQVVFESGHVVNGTLLDHQLPSVLDLPDKITPIIVENSRRTGPHRATGVGETTIIPLAPAIANAVRDAIDIRFSRLPLTPERILSALAEQEALE